MGNRVVQIDYICAICGHKAADGESMWHMGNEIWCESCCDSGGEEEPEPSEPEN